MAINRPNIEEINKFIEKLKNLDWPDTDLTRKFLTILGIHDIVDLEFTLNSKFKKEREAALRMIEKHLDDLLSLDNKVRLEAKDSLKQIYYPVDSPDEEALL